MDNVSTTWGANDWIVLVLVIILMLAIMIFLPRWLVLRAMRKVLKTLRKQNAVDAKSAKPAEQFGAAPPNLWDRMFKMRDYRPQALQQLVQLQIVSMTPDGKYYINQQNLLNSRFHDI